MKNQSKNQSKYAKNTLYRVIDILQNNPELSLKEIARICHMKPPRLNYYLNLIRKNNLGRFVYYINPYCLGYIECGIYLKIDKKNITKVINKLKSNEKVFLIATLIGKFNLFFGAFVRNLYDINEIIKEIARYVREYYIAVREIYREFSRKIRSKERKVIFEYGYINMLKIELDKKDREILKSILANPDESSLEISEKLKIPASTIRHKVREWRKKKFLKRSFFINDLAFNKHLLAMLIRTRDVSEIKRMIEGNELKTCIGYSTTFGSIWNIELYFSYEKFEEFSADYEKISSLSIDSYEILLGFKVEFYDLSRII